MEARSLPMTVYTDCKCIRRRVIDIRLRFKIDTTQRRQTKTDTTFNRTIRAFHDEIM